MKCNRWTVALAAAGLVTFPSLLQADDQKPNSVMTALSSTTISGYVDTSMEWNLGTGNANLPFFAFNSGKQDGFNLDVVELTLQKDPDPADSWGAGYKVQLLFGPDANAFATQSSFTSTSDFGVKQAYVDLRAPIGNGLDMKIGVWDTIIGYEVFEAGNNPNFTRSYGYTVEPTTHTGVLFSYTFNDMISASAGVANTVGPNINDRAPTESYKAYMGSITLTAPKDWGFIGGSTLSAGIVNGFNNVINGNIGLHSQTSVYVGTTVNTPLSNLKVGASMDYVKLHDAGDQDEVRNGNLWVFGAYASYQATEKLTLNVRGEYFVDRANFIEGAGGPDLDDNGGGDESKFWEFTATAQYDLWKNVVSRLEFRWDHTQDNLFGGTSSGSGTRDNAFLVAANIIYKF